VPAQQQPAGAAAAGTSAANTSAAGIAAAAAAAGDDEDLDDMDIDPRTQQQAAARLAQFTSDEALGEHLGGGGDSFCRGYALLSVALQLVTVHRTR
jgi:hypothetical protein